MIYSPELILRHLQTYIPQVTNLFTNEISIDAEIQDGTPQKLVITYANDNLVAGNTIALAGGLLDNGINSATQYTEPDGTEILRLTTNVQHDLTFGYNDNLTDAKIELQGFTDPGLNGFFEIVSIPDTTSFEIETSINPTLNGNEVLRENREIGVNGIFEIASKTTTTMTILLDDVPELDLKPVYGLKIIDGYNISVVANWKRAEEIYTKQLPDINWLFIIMQDVFASKDRNFASDATVTNTNQNEQRIKNIGTFVLNVVIPTAENDLSAANAVQLCYAQIYEILLRVMGGVTFETFDQAKYITTLISHGQVVYNRAYYAHSYEFEFVYETTRQETFSDNFIKSSAFRRIDISFAEAQDGSNIVLPQ